MPKLTIIRLYINLISKAFLNSIFLFYCTKAFNQSTTSNFFSNSSMGLRGYFGSFLTMEAKSEYIRDSYSYFGEIYFEKQTKGIENWQITHKYPSWGVSYLHGNTGSKAYIGNMNAVYAFMNIPVVKMKTFLCSFRLGAGPGWVQKPYNIYTNPKNVVIGTKLNACISMLLQNEIKILPKTYVNASFGLTHLSNGGTSLPNLGLNIPVIAAGFRYAFHEPVFEKNSVNDSLRKKTIYRISVSSAVKQMQLVGGPYNVIFILQPEIATRFVFSHAYSYGIALFFNPYAETNKRSMDIESSSSNTLQVAITGGYEHYFGRLSIPLHVGMYVYGRGKSSLLFQQIGIRIELNKKINTELHLKTHLGKADFIQAGIGYAL